ncbi:MAG: MFS transporter [Anaerolineae bacterium]
MADTEQSVVTAQERVRAHNYALNATAFTLEPTFFWIGMLFVSSSTVLPGLVEQLTGSKVMVGLASGLGTGAFLLPQLFVASASTQLRRKKPLAVIPAWIGRPIYLVPAIALILFGLERPNLTLAAVLAGIVIFHAMDSVSAVPWFDLFAMTIPPNRRGRVLGTAQILSSIAGIGVGVLVRNLLDPEGRWPFPQNYALLFVFATVSMLISAAALSLIREPESSASRNQIPGIKQVLRLLPRILLDDRPFLRCIVVRLLSGFVAVAGSFYVLHATQALGLGAAATGLFVSAQVVGSLSAGLFMVRIQDRYGPLIHVRFILGISLVAPLLALASGALNTLIGQNVLYAYLGVFFFLGVYSGSLSLPFTNWTLEHVDDARRPLYIGITNTLGALTMLAPPLGGWVVSTFSYEAVFVLSVVFACVAALFSFGLPDPRKRSNAGTFALPG